MALLSLQDIHVNFGDPPLLDGVSLQLEPGERVGILGRNGTGKSTLMKIIQGEVRPDSGQVVCAKDMRTSFLPQEIPQSLPGTVLHRVTQGLGKLGETLAEYHAISTQISQTGDQKLLRLLDTLQQTLDGNGGWLIHQQVERTLMSLKLDEHVEFDTLSGGLKRRVLLAETLVSDPDILLLDEPTNHLDLDSITWLEEFLLQNSKTLLFVTHDRMLLKKLATRIVELDRGRLTSWSCDYETFLERKQAALDTEAGHWAQFDKKLAQEEAWIRQGIKARRTRNEGRVRVLLELRQQRKNRREQVGTARLQVQEAERSGKLVLRATDVGYAYGDNAVVRGFSVTIMRGDKIGIIGPNGAGKTTLLQLLLGELTPQHGQVEQGTRLAVAYFDQLRTPLDEDKTVQEIVGRGDDYIPFNGKDRHIMGYLRDFLFSADRVRSPVSVLSGGERNRLLLARLFSQPSNVLVLDEPTNDLDAETLELLEELLLEYTGTVLLVSHDRMFLNNVATSTLVFEDEGQINEYVGGYDDWLRQRWPAQPADSAPTQPDQKKSLPRRDRTPRPRKLSYKEQRELEELPQRIETLESEQAAVHATLADPELYRQGGEKFAALHARLTILEQELEAAYQRWETLEAIPQ